MASVSRNAQNVKESPLENRRRSGPLGGGELLDPASHLGDAGVDPIVVGTATADAPADHACKEPAARRLLAH